MTKRNIPAALVKHRSQQLSILIILIAVVVFLFAGNSYAQSDSEHRLTFHAGVGPTPLTGDISERLDNGWQVTVGGGINFSKYLSTTLDYTYHGLGVSRRVLAEAQVPDGSARLWSLTLNPKIRFAGRGRIAPYIVGGVGYYRRSIEFTRPTILPTVIFDPFFGVFFNALVPSNIVIGRITADGIGGSLGGGFDAGLGRAGLKLFTEARYHYADTGRIPTRMVPVTIGIRW